jgi:LDH2 family malate/lactate/ureidoglycolate dehydrogenase
MQKRLNAYFEKLRTSNLLDPERKIYIHGEKEIEKERRCRETGIPIEESVWEEFAAICGRNGVARPGAVKGRCRP